MYRYHTRGSSLPSASMEIITGTLHRKVSMPHMQDEKKTDMRANIVADFDGLSGKVFSQPRALEKSPISNLSVPVNGGRRRTTIDRKMTHLDGDKSNRSNKSVLSMNGRRIMG